MIPLPRLLVLLLLLVFPLFLDLLVVVVAAVAAVKRCLEVKHSGLVLVAVSLLHLHLVVAVKPPPPCGGAIGPVGGDVEELSPESKTHPPGGMPSDLVG
jgi:hypothetical protein